MGYPQLKHYDVLDDLYDWEEDLQESLEAAAEDLAAILLKRYGVPHPYPLPSQWRSVHQDFS